VAAVVLDITAERLAEQAAAVKVQQEPLTIRELMEQRTQAAVVAVVEITPAATQAATVEAES
jgi:hypothetical protein